MHITELELKDFRNHKYIKLSFDNAPTIIVGPNGIGKTNILEAIHLLSTTKSLKATYDREMISHEEKLTRVATKVLKASELETTEVKEFRYIDLTQQQEDSAKTRNSWDLESLELYIVKSDTYANASSKKTTINGVKRSITNFAGYINTILFTPSDISLLTSAPALRRRYLDAIFFQIDKTYKQSVAEYEKAKKQRNKLLETIRETGRGYDLIEFWEEKLIKNGQYIQEMRRDFFAHVNNTIEETAVKLSDNYKKVEIIYDKSEITQERLNKYKHAEIATGRTLVGPHKDDFYITLNDYHSGNYASRGQQRSMVLALKLCELEYITGKTNERPILLLDDVFSELDERHRQAIENIIWNQQTIITSTDRNL
ncbi:MAG: DNA replication/repair protein RecF [Patescibacteria group bacterium]|uniref:DNA replication and repair protein RecF n=1 Tax=candidate division WWE3 bacterium TaxID=2053526 RepID=A0A955EAM9_UNCKA|nr:DNA replication/repair protein RecF [candidate division WWE3 bacterium]